MGERNKHIENLRKGNRSSFEYLYTVWSGKLYNFVMKISHGDSYLAEEMVQTVFLKVWKNREQLDPKLSFGAYLCTIAKNLLTNHYQHKMMEILYIEQQIDHPGTPYARGTDEVVEYHLLEEFVDSLIQQMPEGRQRIYKLSRQSHLSNREIADQLQISENTVESQLTKAISFLRKRLKDLYDLGLLALSCLLNS